MIDAPPDSLPPALRHPPQSLEAPPGRRTAVWVTVALGVGGGALGYLVLGELVLGRQGLHLDMKGWGPAEWTTLGVGWLLALWLVAAIHELGHLLGARLAGWRAALWCVGPIRLDFAAGRMRLSLNRALSTWPGLAAAVPPRGRDTPSAMALVAAGGPLASLLLAAAAAWVAMGTSGWSGLAWGGIAALSGAIGLATLLPSELGGFRSDGAQLLALWRRDPGAVERLAFATLWTQSMAGVRPRDWDPDALAAASQAQADGQVALFGALMQALATLDRRDPVAARHEFERYAERLHAKGALAQVAAPFRPGLLLPVAVYLGQFAGHAAAARAWWEASSGGTVEPHARAHARAAVAWAEGRWADARVAAEEARLLGQASIDPGGWQATQADLDELLERLDAVMPSSPGR